MEWKDQYKHPEWQKIRLYALDRAGFECENCGTKDETLHVHHKRYIKGRKIWEYEPDNFAVLCENCHADFHDSKEMLLKILTLIPTAHMRALAGLVAGWARDYVPPEIAAEYYCQDFWASDMGEMSWIWGCDFDIKTIETFKSLSPDYAKEIAEAIRNN